MGQSRQQWEDRTREALGDEGVLQIIGELNVDAALHSALAKLGRDYPREIDDRFNGDGTAFQFTLTAWVLGHGGSLSRMLTVEYPYDPLGGDDREEQFIDLNHEAVVLRGTAILRFLTITPETGTNNIRVRYTIPLWPQPNDVTGASSADLIPDNLFVPVAHLAGHYVALGLATEMARRQSKTIRGQLFDQDSDRMFAAARNLKAVYDEHVLGIRAGGEEAKNPVAYAVTDIDSPFGVTVFHGGRR